jgi:tetratricopeptide (TPR) repeat protein
MRVLGRLQGYLRGSRSLGGRLAPAVALIVLVGCGSSNKTIGLLTATQDRDAAATGADNPPIDAPKGPRDAAAPEATGTIQAPAPVISAPTPPPDAQAVIPDPDSDLNRGKRQFRAGNFGLAERYFRRAVEAAPGDAHRDAEAWLGLAACYDRLRRFELADRSYGQALKILGPTAELLNNQGYSYLLRGDYHRARIKLAAAHDRDPNNAYIQNNLDLLDRSARGRSR